MTTEQYLGQLRYLKRQIDSKRRDAEMWRSVAVGLESLKDGDRVQNSGSHDKLGGAIARAIDCENDSIDLTTKLITLQAKIIRQIDELPNPEHSLVLSEYYVHEMSVPQIAEEWDKSCRHVIRIKNDALLAFAERYVHNF